MSNESYGTIIVHTGVMSNKFINNELVSVTPLVVSHGHEFGVGLSLIWEGDKAETLTYGNIMYHHLIQSWRATKLLEALPRINIYSTPGECWVLAKEKLASYEETVLDEVSELYDDYESFRQLRANILASFPTPDTLASMRAVLKQHDIKITTEEILDSRNKLESEKVILKRLIEFDAKRRGENFAEVIEEAKQVSLRMTADAPKRRSLFERVFG